jgi:hypothetical protein
MGSEHDEGNTGRYTLSLSKRRHGMWSRESTAAAAHSRGVIVQSLGNRVTFEYFRSR